MISLLSERLHYYETRIEDAMLKEVPARLASLILFLVEHEGVQIPGEIRVPTHYTHEHLGTMIGANREAVTRAFGRLQDEGAVQIRRRIIYVNDVEVLERAAGRLLEEEGEDLSWAPLLRSSRLPGATLSCPHPDRRELFAWRTLPSRAVPPVTARHLASPGGLPPSTTGPRGRASRPSRRSVLPAWPPAHAPYTGRGHPRTPPRFPGKKSRLFARGVGMVADLPAASAPFYNVFS
jgi:hypothetical protein